MFTLLKIIRKNKTAENILAHALRIKLLPSRFRFARSYYRKPLNNIWHWLITSRETSNFTYQLEETNQLYLAHFISVITHVSVDAIMVYLKEIEDDVELRNHIQTATKKSTLRYMADDEVHYGRRIGWYAFVRATKPKVVVETGTDKGLGSCVLTAALMRNSTEGFPGHLYTLDIDPGAGYLLQPPYTSYGEVVYGDSITTLNKFEKMIDLFINDSDHSAEYEGKEYRAIAEKMNAAGLILGDNAHVTKELVQFAQETDRQFLFFQEKPKDHWYPGASIGVAFKV